MLNITNMDVSYGATPVVQGLDMSIRTGEVCCLMGRNGVGKTSSLRAIAGQHLPSAGQIEWKGRDISRLPAHARARMGIAIVPQGRDIFSQLTVQENLETGFAGLPRRQRSIPDMVWELFPVLDEMRQRRGGDLSGGQQQQLAIGRALVMRPDMLILDEPTEGIQPNIIAQIRDVIAMLRDQGNMAILLVEQYMDFAQALADQILVMERGQIRMRGAPSELDNNELHRWMSV
jgi:urea transport system ATP-binding protein